MTAASTPSRPRWTAPSDEQVAVVARRVVALAFWFVVPIFCLFVLASGVDKLVVHINNVPAGVRGVFTVQAHDCQALCVTRGTFTSDDGRFVATDQLGSYSWLATEKHQAVYDVSSGDVIPLPARWDPTSTVVGMAGALGVIVLWSCCVYGSVRRRIPATAGAAGDDTAGQPVD